MSFSWRSSNHQKKPLKNQLERQDLAFLWYYPLYGHFEESQESQREVHWGIAISSSSSLPSQRMDLPLQDTCTLAGVCRDHSVGQKCKCLSSIAWHCVGGEGLWVQGGFLFYIYMQSAWAPGCSSWWLTHSVAVLWHRCVRCVGWVLF